jgi:hypothetical protein
MITIKPKNCETTTLIVKKHKFRCLLQAVWILDSKLECTLANSEKCKAFALAETSLREKPYNH